MNSDRSVDYIGHMLEATLANPNRETLAAISDSYSDKLIKAKSIDALFESANN